MSLNNLVGSVIEVTVDGQRAICSDPLSQSIVLFGQGLRVMMLQFDLYFLLCVTSQREPSCFLTFIHVFWEKSGCVCTRYARS